MNEDVEPTGAAQTPPEVKEQTVEADSQKADSQPKKERPWWHTITPEVAEAIQKTNGDDISAHIGKKWTVWGFSSWGGGDVPPPNNLTDILRPIAEEHGWDTSFDSAGRPPVSVPVPGAKK